MALFEALARQPEEVDRFLGAITGSTPLDQYLSPGNLVRILGLRAMLGIMLGRLRPARRRDVAPPPREAAEASR
jgi:hypothetical protein